MLLFIAMNTSIQPYQFEPRSSRARERKSTRSDDDQVKKLSSESERLLSTTTSWCIVHSASLCHL